jgi:hypothetical protein
MKKRNIFRFVFGIIAICVLIPGIFIAVFSIPLVEAQYYKYSEPSNLVSEFLIALNDNNLNLAKEFVVPSLRERIDRWVTESAHIASPCQSYDLIEPFEGAIVSGGPNPKGKEANLYASWSCYTGNQPEMRIENVTLSHSIGGWVITDWDKICYSSYSEPEKCYKK